MSLAHARSRNVRNKHCRSALLLPSGTVSWLFLTLWSTHQHAHTHMTTPWSSRECSGNVAQGHATPMQHIVHSLASTCKGFHACMQQCTPGLGTYLRPTLPAMFPAMTRPLVCHLQRFSGTCSFHGSHTFLRHLGGYAATVTQATLAPEWLDVVATRALYKIRDTLPPAHPHGQTLD
jgi:hypothetical protein